MSSLDWLASVTSSVFVVTTQVQAIIYVTNPDCVFTSWHYTLIMLAFLIITILFNTWGRQNTANAGNHLPEWSSCRIRHHNSSSLGVMLQKFRSSGLYQCSQQWRLEQYWNCLALSVKSRSSIVIWVRIVSPISVSLINPGAFEVVIDSLCSRRSRACFAQCSASYVVELSCQGLHGHYDADNNAFLHRRP